MPTTNPINENQTRIVDYNNNQNRVDRNDPEGALPQNRVNTQQERSAFSFLREGRRLIQERCTNIILQSSIDLFCIELILIPGSLLLFVFIIIWLIKLNVMHSFFPPLFP